MKPAPGTLLLILLVPLLGASSSTTGAAGISLVAIMLTLSAHVVARGLRAHLTPLFMAATLVVFWTAMVSGCEQILEAWWPSLAGQLGIFLPLLAAHCVLAVTLGLGLTRHEPSNPRHALIAALGFAGVALILGVTREFIGHGSLLQNVTRLAEAFGAPTEQPGIIAFGPESGFVLALLPPGGFIALGLTLALVNAIHNRKKSP